MNESSILNSLAAIPDIKSIHTANWARPIIAQSINKLTGKRQAND